MVRGEHPVESKGFSPCCAMRQISLLIRSYDVSMRRPLFLRSDAMDAVLSLSR